MSATLAEIEARTSKGLRALEWALNYKTQLRDRCREAGEHELAAAFDKEIQSLQFDLNIHVVAAALVRGAR